LLKLNSIFRQYNVITGTIQLSQTHHAVLTTVQYTKQ